MRLDLPNLSLLRGLAWGLAAGIVLTLATQCQLGRGADAEAAGELRQLTRVTDAAIVRQHATAVVVRQRTAAVAAAHRASTAALDRAATLHRRVQIAAPTVLRVQLAPVGTTASNIARDTLLTVPHVVVARLVADSVAIDSLQNEIRQHEGLDSAYMAMHAADATRIAAETEQIDVLAREKRPRCGAKCGAALTVVGLVAGGVVLHNAATIGRALLALLHGKPP